MPSPPRGTREENGDAFPPPKVSQDLSPLLPPPFRLFSSRETGCTSYIKGRSRQLGSNLPSCGAFSTLTVRFRRASRAYRCVHLCLHTCPALCSRACWVFVRVTPQPRQWQRNWSSPHMCFLFCLFFGRGVVGSGDNRVYLLLKCRRGKPQRHFTAVC